MIKIENKEFKTIESPDGGMSTYAKLISMAIGSQVVTKGVTFDEMERVLAVKKALDNANGHIELSKPQLAYLQKTLPQVKWTMVNEEIIQLKNFILEA